MNIISKQLYRITGGQDTCYHKGYGSNRNIFINGIPTNYWVYAFNRREAFYLPFVLGKDTVEIRYVG